MKWIVDRQQFVIEAELVPDARLLSLTAGDFQHPIEEILEQRAGAMGGGIAQGGEPGSGGQAQVPQFAFAGGEPVGNVAQAVDRAQLTEPASPPTVPD